MGGSFQNNYFEFLYQSGWSAQKSDEKSCLLTQRQSPMLVCYFELENKATFDSKHFSYYFGTAAITSHKFCKKEEIAKSRGFSGK